MIEKEQVRHIEGTNGRNDPPGAGLRGLSGGADGLAQSFVPTEAHDSVTLGSSSPWEFSD